ncbi:hypothetical protein [Zymobacter sp. IVIA_12111.31 C1]|uniref:hypothetical protein n=1 Tax=Zymobacter sp. IVIA_12111.31 C1 TaxID=3394854 RepID=UPI0039C1FA1C
MNVDKVFKESYFQSYYSEDKVLQGLYVSQFKDKIEEMVNGNELCEDLLVEIHVRIRNRMLDKILEYKLNTINKIMLFEMIDEIVYFSDREITKKSLEIIFDKVSKFNLFYHSFIFNIAYQKAKEDTK